MTKAELADHMQEEKESYEAQLQAMRREAQLAVETAEEKAEADRQLKITAQKGKSKAQSKAAAAEASKKGHTDRVRKEERAKAKEEVGCIRARAAEDADEALVAKAAKKQARATAAHAKKRYWHGRCEKAEALADARLEELKMLRCKRACIVEELEELKCADKEEGDLRAKQLEAWARQQAMPTWQAYRAKGRGGGRSFDADYRVTIYSAIANQVPLSAIGPTIVDVVKRTAPWLEPQAPTRGMLNEARFELRLIEEALGGRRVALAYAIRMLGFDETTKNGNPSITSNVIIEPTRGATLEPVILRGAYCSAGGTSGLPAPHVNARGNPLR